MNFDVRFVNKNSEEISQVRELYENTFNDTKEYIKFLFDSIVPDSDTEIIAGFIDNKLISMMFLRKKKLLSVRQSVKSCLIYGVATVEEYRNRGYMKRLMECALSYCGSIDIPFLYLIPIDPGIYESMGFVLAREEKKIPLQDIECQKEEYTVEKVCMDKEHSECCKNISDFSIMVESANRGITVEKDELYFKRRLEQTYVENAGIYVIRNKDNSCDMEAIVVTGTAEDDGKIYVTDIICAGEWDDSFKYAKLVTDMEADIMPFVRLKPIMIYNGMNMDLYIKLNEDI